MGNIVKIVKSLGDSSLLLKGVVKMARSQRRGIYRPGKGKGIVRAVYGNKMDF